ncbi:MAG TPA: nucleotide exchange factor GrpE [Smithella sp.]|nr:nucleotide exchange factor GrpE [Smithella sp.]MDM7987943.1 nucleotide exchange factor GrpE [Smithella sp.]HNY50628.1 nucleotide exchange factor GrpE [Smithella sp.]HOG89195.1 nucleotide exchange factor GrpE [Smithella sp.]HOU49947.1 nucleotide exchange factor GrpE [Smithella sp.]
MVKLKKDHSEHQKKNEPSAEHPNDKVAAKDQHQEIEDLRKQLEEKEKEAAAHYDKYVRSVAEFDNYKKRAARDKADAIKYGNENIIKDILPFMDSLDRALEHDTGDIQAFKDGVALIQDQLLCCLKKYGVEKIDAAGKDFDPNFHEALMQVASDEHENNKIVSEMEKGYLLNGRLLRPSRVCVCKKTNVSENNNKDDEFDITEDSEE